jgi:hypothetical protein
MKQSLTMDEIFKLVHGEMEKIDDVKLFYELRKRQLKYFYHQRIYLKVVIALTKLHLPITSSMLSFIMSKRSSLNIPSLHCLGDKHLLILKRVIGRHYEWIASPLLLDLIKSIEKNEG